MGKNFFHARNGLSVESTPSTPTGLQNGDMFYDATRNSFVFRNNGSNTDLQNTVDVASAASLTSANFTALSVQASVIRVTGTTASDIHGLTASSNAKSLIMYNATNSDLTIKGNSASEGTLANRILTPDNEDLVVSAGKIATFFYDAAQSRWVASIGGSDGGGITLDTLFAFTADDPIGLWGRGHNPTFGGIGVMEGSLAIYTGATVINGDSSYRYNSGATPGLALDDWWRTPPREVPLKFRGKTVVWIFSHVNNMGGSLSPVAWDATNNVALNNYTVQRVPVTGTQVATYRLYFDIPVSCTSLQLGFQVRDLPPANSYIEFDDMYVTADLASYWQHDDGVSTNWVQYSPVYAGFGTTVNNDTIWRRDGSDLLVMGRFVAGTVAASQAQIGLPPGLLVRSTNRVFPLQRTKVGDGVNSGLYAPARMASAEAIVARPGDNFVTFAFQDASTGGDTTPRNGNAVLANGEAMTFQFRVPIEGWGVRETSAEVLAMIDDKVSYSNVGFVYAGSAQYTLTTLDTAPVGTFITWTYTINSNSITQTNAAAPTQSTSDMNANGIQIFSRAYNAASTAAQPARIAIQVGKNYEGMNLNIYQSTGLVNAGTLDAVASNDNRESGLLVKNYNKETGILVLDAGHNLNSSTTNKFFMFSNIVTQNNGYITFSGSKVPALVGTPIARYQVKTLPGNIAGSGPIAALSFNNLIIGRSYRIVLQCNAYSNQNSGAPNGIAAVHNGVTLCRTGISASVPLYNHSAGVEAIFIAQTTTLSVNGVNLNGAKQVFGNGTTDQTFAMLEEMVAHPTTAFT